jgi:probable phosphoglycerate mutase
MRPEPQSRWPAKLWIIRHGESAGNVANAAALAAKSQRIDLLGRDMDVPLSPLGLDQAAALGTWFSAMPPDERPEHIMASPYARTSMTALAIAQQTGLANRVIVDERLREKELGALDRLTRFGVEALFPDQAQLRSTIGKFYYRPPGGESWCDVILRLRSALETICVHYAGKRLVIVSHQVVVMCFRYVLENLNEEQVLAIDAAGDVKNCAVTEYGFRAAPPCGLKLLRYNFSAPLEEAGAPVTAEKSEPPK